MDHFGQLLTAAITPFDSNGVMETDTFWRLCKKLVGEGSDGIVLTGTTAESPNLTESDRLNIYSTAKDAVGDKSKLIAGTGTYSTKESIHFTKLAEEVGMHGIMIVAPYYNKPSQIGILKHFESIKLYQSPRFTTSGTSTSNLLSERGSRYARNRSRSGIFGQSSPCKSNSCRLSKRASVPSISPSSSVLGSMIVKRLPQSLNV